MTDCSKLIISKLTSDSESEENSSQTNGFTSHHLNGYSTQHYSGYTAQQLQDWYANVASRSRQIEIEAYYMTLNTLQQQFGPRN